MKKDIEAIIEQMALKHPQVKVEQLKVTHKADDDGLWYFFINRNRSVQLESSSYNFPFLLESEINCKTVNSIDEAINALCDALEIK